MIDDQYQPDTSWTMFVGTSDHAFLHNSSTKVKCKATHLSCFVAFACDYNCKSRWLNINPPYRSAHDILVDGKFVLWFCSHCSAS